MDRWSFFQVIAYDRKGREVYYDRPPSFGKFLLLCAYGLARTSSKGYRTRFKMGDFNWYWRCGKLPWRPW
jgi:hypothetical protein